MKRALENGLSEFLIGLLFGFGLILSGMTDPGKVIGFLDLFGRWDPSLAFVMGGAVASALCGLPPLSLCRWGSLRTGCWAQWMWRRL